MESTKKQKKKPQSLPGGAPATSRPNCSPIAIACNTRRSSGAPKRRPLCYTPFPFRVCRKQTPPLP